MKIEEAIRYFEAKENETVEALADRLISQSCDAVCLVECCNGDEDTCRRCPLTELHGLIYGE